MGNEHYLTEQDYELLSAYLDGELSAAEQASLEARLQVEPVLGQELESLRQTILMIRQLAVLRAPRNFTLDVSMIPPAGAVRRRPFFASGMFSALSSAAAVALLLLGVFLYGQQPATYSSYMSDIAAVGSHVAREAPVVAQAATTTPALIGGAVMPPASMPDDAAEAITQDNLRSFSPLVEEEEESPPQAESSIEMPLAAVPPLAGSGIIENAELLTEITDAIGLIEADTTTPDETGDIAAPVPAIAPIPEASSTTAEDIIAFEPSIQQDTAETGISMETIALSMILASAVFFVIAAISGFAWWRQGTL